MIENPLFAYDRTAASTQTLLPFEPRSESNTTRIHLRAKPGATLIRIGYVDATMSNAVTPRFLIDDSHSFPESLADATVLLEGERVEEAQKNQLYVLGHGQLNTKGVVARITGMATGQGQGAGNDSSFDLFIEALDLFSGTVVTGDSTLIFPQLILEMQHDGPGPITYGATIIVGN
jgi:hypothetical protein